MCIGTRIYRTTYTCFYQLVIQLIPALMNTDISTVKSLFDGLEAEVVVEQAIGLLKSGFCRLCYLDVSTAVWSLVLK